MLEYLDLLDAQRTQDAAQDAAAQSRAAVASDAVALFKALGGGWTDETAHAGTTETRTGSDTARVETMPAARAVAR